MPVRSRRAIRRRPAPSRTARRTETRHSALRQLRSKEWRALGLLAVGGLLLLNLATRTPTTEEPTPTGGVGNVVLSVVRAPLCPVETTPPDPACAPAPMSDVAVLVVGVGGTVGLPHSTVDGTILLVLPPGTYAITPQPVDGFSSTAPAFELVVPERETVRHTITYDTGIR